MCLLSCSQGSAPVSHIKKNRRHEGPQFVEDPCPVLVQFQSSLNTVIVQFKSSSSPGIVQFQYGVSLVQF